MKYRSHPTKHQTDVIPERATFVVHARYDIIELHGAYYDGAATNVWSAPASNSFGSAAYTIRAERCEAVDCGILPSVSSRGRLRSMWRAGVVCVCACVGAWFGVGGGGEWVGRCAILEAGCTSPVCAPDNIALYN